LNDLYMADNNNNNISARALEKSLLKISKF